MGENYAEVDYVAQGSWLRGWCMRKGQIDEVSINKEKENVGREKEICKLCLNACEEGRDRERSCQFKRDREKMTDVAGGMERSQRQPLRDCAVNPLPRLSPPPPPCVLCHGYQTGLPMQPVNVFFSGRSDRGTNVSQSVSCTINVNCPGMHKHMEGCEPGNTRPPWLSVRVRIWNGTTSWFPDNCSSGFVALSAKTETVMKFCYSGWDLLHIDCKNIDLKCLSCIRFLTGCPTSHTNYQLIFRVLVSVYLVSMVHNRHNTGFQHSLNFIVKLSVDQNQNKVKIIHP